jgi:hypothetical protein
MQLIGRTPLHCSTLTPAKFLFSAGDYIGFILWSGMSMIDKAAVDDGGTRSTNRSSDYGCVNVQKQECRPRA